MMVGVKELAYGGFVDFHFEPPHAQGTIITAIVSLDGMIRDENIGNSGRWNGIQIDRCAKLLRTFELLGIQKFNSGGSASKNHVGAYERLFKRRLVVRRQRNKAIGWNALRDQGLTAVHCPSHFSTHKNGEAALTSHQLANGLPNRTSPSEDEGFSVRKIDVLCSAQDCCGCRRITAVAILHDRNAKRIEAGCSRGFRYASTGDNIGPADEDRRRGKIAGPTREHRPVY
jgi:hypothetical protein